MEKDFLIDFIITSINLRDGDNDDLSFQFKFDDNTIDIKSSRINVRDFKEGRGLTLNISPEELQEKLENNPLYIDVSRSDEKLGVVTIEWPDSIKDRVSSDDFVEKSHVGEYDVCDDDEDVIGQISVGFKFSTKSSGIPICPSIDDQGKLKISEDFDDLLDPEDVLFVIGDCGDGNKPNPYKGKFPLGPCGAVDCPGRLDSSTNYKMMNGKLVNNDDVVGPCGNLGCPVGAQARDDICASILAKRNRCTCGTKRNITSGMYGPGETYPKPWDEILGKRPKSPLKKPTSCKELFGNDATCSGPCSRPAPQPCCCCQQPTEPSIVCEASIHSGTCPYAPRPPCCCNPTVLEKGDSCPCMLYPPFKPCTCSAKPPPNNNQNVCTCGQQQKPCPPPPCPPPPCPKPRSVCPCSFEAPCPAPGASCQKQKRNPYNLCQDNGSGDIVGPNIEPYPGVPAKRCPCCFQAMDWMPAGAACPRCGYKKPPPNKYMPKKYDAQMSADEILAKWGGVDRTKQLRSFSEERKRNCYCKDSKNRVTASKSNGSNDWHINDANHSPGDRSSGQHTNKQPSYTPGRQPDPYVPHLTECLQHLKDMEREGKRKGYFDDSGSDSSRDEKTDKPEKCNSRKLKDKKKKPPKDKKKNSKIGKKGDSCQPVSALKTKKRITSRKEFIKEMKKRFKGKYSYKFGNRYPGVVLGHKTCKADGGAVPPYMGWLWNVEIPGINKIRRGWKPGAVSKTIKELMCYFLEPCPADTLPNTRRPRKRPPPEKEEPLVQKPTLRIQKKNGQYTITMHPLKTCEELKSSPDPYAACKPLKFKITRTPEEDACSQLKKAMLEKYKKCTCKQSIPNCTCRDNKEKQLITKELEQYERDLKIKDLENKLKLSDSTDGSELDIEFTPPAGLIKETLGKKPDNIYRETQYDVNDFIKKKIDDSTGGGKCKKKGGCGKGGAAKKRKPKVIEDECGGGAVVDTRPPPCPPCPCPCPCNPCCCYCCCQYNPCQTQGAEVDVCQRGLEQQYQQKSIYDNYPMQITYEPPQVPSYCCSMPSYCNGCLYPSQVVMPPQCYPPQPPYSQQQQQQLPMPQQPPLPRPRSPQECWC